MPETHHRTAVPLDEEPALLAAQLKSLGAGACFASGSRSCGAGQCRPSRGDLLQVQAVLSASPIGKCGTVVVHL